VYVIVGGIYTVIRSKAPVTVDELKNQYCLIGPYKEHNVNMEVEVCEPQNNAIKEAMAELQKDEIKVIFYQLTVLTIHVVILAHLHVTSKMPVQS
jgi:glycogen(starch) synthase